MALHLTGTTARRITTSFAATLPLPVATFLSPTTAASTTLSTPSSEAASNVCLTEEDADYSSGWMAAEHMLQARLIGEELTGVAASNFLEYKSLMAEDYPPIVENDTYILPVASTSQLTLSQTPYTTLNQLRTPRSALYVSSKYIRSSSPTSSRSVLTSPHHPHLSTSRIRAGLSLSSRRNIATLRPTPPISSPVLHSQERPKVDSTVPLPVSSSLKADIGGLFGFRGFGMELGKGKNVERKEAEAGPASTKSTPYVGELNTLLRHPALYDPVLAPRFPIVLCHGLYGFSERGPAFFRLHYWGDLLKILRGKVGAEVFVTAVPGTGAIKNRAHVLHQSLQETPELQGRDLNFVAHSMGGLDARYLLSSIHPTTYHPRSLTTLSTPHRGSEFMSWCRANIGIGTDFDQTSEAAARASHESLSIPLPFSLKAPILTRTAAQTIQDDKVAAAEKASAVARNFPGLPITLSTSFSTYLLELLDSPAYANLTPSFMSNVFNPSTPDRPDIKYYSVAARTEKIGIWHPLWLPKLVLDGAESARVAKGGPGVPTPQWRGNDGLVNVESAKWGEFLGILDNCDHWGIRGSSGLINAAATAKAVAEATGTVGSGSGGNVDAKGVSADGKRSWQWQDVYALVGKSKEATKRERESGEVAVDKKDAGLALKAESEDAKGLRNIASWLTEKIPTDVTKVIPTIPLPKIPFVASPATSSSSESSTSSPTSPTSDARMLYGALTSSSKPDKFNLERLALALCRKLHNEGL